MAVVTISRHFGAGGLTLGENLCDRFGFQLVDREAVPATVKGSIEFTSACPDSALAMALNLEGVPGHIRV